MKRKKPKQLKKPQETAADLAGVAMLTIRRAAIVSGYTVWHLRKLVWAGEIECERIGHKIMINREKLLAYIAKKAA